MKNVMKGFSIVLLLVMVSSLFGNALAQDVGCMHQHTKIVDTEFESDEDPSIYKDLGDGTHSVILHTDAYIECEDCGTVLESFVLVHDAATEPHAYYFPGKAVGDPVITYEMTADTHTKTTTTLSRTMCSCGALGKYYNYSIHGMPTQHTFSKSADGTKEVCTECGYEKTATEACKHENKTERERHEYICLDNGDGTHTEYDETYLDEYCADCGILLKKADKAYEIFVHDAEGHFYDELAIEDKDILIIENYYEDLGNGQHLWVSRMEVYHAYCVKCGADMGEDVIYKENEKIEPHQYAAVPDADGLYRCACGAVMQGQPGEDTQEHEHNENNIGNPRPLEWRPDNDSPGWHYLYTGEFDLMCDVCGTVVRTVSSGIMDPFTFRDYPGATRQRCVFENGTCIICGYHHLSDAQDEITDTAPAEPTDHTDHTEPEKEESTDRKNTDRKLDLELDLASLAQKILQAINKGAKSRKNETTAALAAIKKQIKPTIGNKNIPDQVYEAIATAILGVLDGSVIEKYETDQNKLVEQIYNQVKDGVDNFHNKTIKIGKTTYILNGQVMANSGLGVAFLTVNWEGHSASFTWTNVKSEDGKQALADYCAKLAQLNGDVWKEFMAYYVSDLANLIGVPVTKKNASTVLDYAEKTINAICDKDAANELVKELGDKAAEKLESGLFAWQKNQFRSFIEEYVPGGSLIIQAADKYNELKKKYDEFVKQVEDYKNADEAEQVYKELKETYNAIEQLLGSI